MIDKIVIVFCSHISTTFPHIAGLKLSIYKSSNGRGEAEQKQKINEVNYKQKVILKVNTET